MKYLKFLVVVCLIILLSACSSIFGPTDTGTSQILEISPQKFNASPTEIEPTQNETPTKKPTPIDSIPDFLLLTEEISEQINTVMKEEFKHNNSYGPVKIGLQWEIKYSDGKKIVLKVTDAPNGLVSMILDTSELAGKKSIFTVVTSRGAVVEIQSLSYYGLEHGWQAFLFSPSTNEFVMCPNYNGTNWYCYKTKFSTDGSIYVPLLISHLGVVVINATTEQDTNISRNLKLENNGIFLDRSITKNKNAWCGVLGEKEIEYKLPGDVRTYKFGYGNCPVVQITPLIEVTETNIDDLGF